MDWKVDDYNEAAAKSQNQAGGCEPASQHLRGMGRQDCLGRKYCPPSAPYFREVCNPLLDNSIQLACSRVCQQHMVWPSCRSCCGGGGGGGGGSGGGSGGGGGSSDGLPSRRTSETLVARSLAPSLSVCSTFASSSLC